MKHRLGQHAIVIGGSLAGMMTARVLADHFDLVTILERDRLEQNPAPRRSVPQGNHLHTLLLGGEQVFSSLYPGIISMLESHGTVRCRLGKEIAFHVPDGKAYSITGTVREQRDLGYDIFCQSRALLEHCVRVRTQAYQNVHWIDNGQVQELLHSNGYIYGVSFTHDGVENKLLADLVVDATGRGSRLPRWLQDLGYQAPEETTIGVDLGYASTRFRIPDTYTDHERVHLFIGPAPHYPNGATMQEIENRQWQVTLIGRFGNYPPTDPEGFMEFAKSLYTPYLYEQIKDAERVADIVQYRFPQSKQRHYERLEVFPEGLLVLGDAVCCFNPAYGQGMSSAAQQVKVLQDVLAQRKDSEHPLKGLAADFFPKVAEVLETPWGLSASEDLTFPQTEGVRPPNMEEEGQYFMAIDALSADDIEVHKLIVEVFNLSKPLSALLEEPLYSRAVKYLEEVYS